jgi:hypothetical protein
MKCKKKTEVKVPKDALYQYNQGRFIEDAFHMLNAGEREFLISGYCSICFTIIAKEIEEEE